MTMGAQDRRGSLWTGADYAEFVTALRISMTEVEVADRLGRSRGAIRSRARFLLLDAYKSGVALEKLRTMVSDPEFDWEGLVREAHAHAGMPYWDGDSDAGLISAWAQSPPPSMHSLTSDFDVDEQAIARRCLELNLAQSRAEVVDHLGAESGGVLAVQATLARDKAGSSVGVLVVTSEGGAVVHLSLHPDIGAATRACGELDDQTLAETPAMWTVATRVVGEGSVRASQGGPWETRQDSAPGAS
ncbi:hypothetical protein [Nocardia sp. NPDC051832]|uniref:hypothetical protein n=1 Tax=Nocardia sp. NPDC051832 TaxID=3155673 RepID=UPI0034257B9F